MTGFRTVLSFGAYPSPGKFARIAAPLTLLLTAALSLPSAGAQQLQFSSAQIIVLAGTGTAATNCLDTGDGGLSTNANLCTPYVAVQDTAGNIYFADQNDNTVKKIDTRSYITTFAGIASNGPKASSGDGGPATSANLYSPMGLAFDPSGNLYIATYDGLIRKVLINTGSTNGTISTFVGKTSGSFFAAGTGTAASLGPITGIATDSSGNIYVAAGLGHLVIKVNSSGTASLFAGVQTTSGNAGTYGYNGDNISATTAELNLPYDVAVDTAGNVYIADYGNYRVRKVDTTGKITTIAGDGMQDNYGGSGQATSASVRPLSVAVDLAGDVYINDSEPSTKYIRKVTPAGIITTVAGGGATNLGPAGTGPGGPALEASLASPASIRIDNQGDILLPDTANASLYSVGPNGYVDFGTQAVGTSSAAIVLSVENTGNAAVTLPSIHAVAGTGSPNLRPMDGAVSPQPEILSPIGADPSDFNVSATTCGSTLASGSSCTISVVYTPTAPGPRLAQLSLSTKAAGSPQVIFLLGMATASPPAIVTASPTSLNFGTELWEHVTSPQYVTLTNTSGYYTATFGAISSTDGDFTVSAYSCGATLAPGATCQLSVTFEPLTYANQSYSGTGSIQYTSNSGPAGATPTSVTFSLSGNGITYPPGVSATPTSIAFGNQTEYTQSPPQTVYVLNESSATINFTGTTISGPFSIYQDGCGFGIRAGYQCTYLVAFSPTTVGTPQTGTLTIPFSGASGSPLTVSLTGNGTTGTPAILLSPSSQVNFGATPVGTPPIVTPVTQQVTIYNNGTAPMTGIVITITGTNASDFSETDNCAANSPIQPQYANNCVITVSFSAGAAGARNAMLNVSSNAGNSPQSVVLTGAGVASAAQLQFTPAQLNLIAGSGAACGSTMATTTATSATLCNVNSAAQDYLGNTYLVDTNYNVVYKVDTTGNLSVFAGTPSLTGGYGGDNGPATSATLSGPKSVAADAFGNVFISDTGNNTIREVSGGTITTYINPRGGCGGQRPSSGPQPRAAAPTAHVVYACVQQFTPQGIIFDRSGNFYIADPYNDVVWEVQSQQSSLTIVAGIGGSAGYNGDNILATTAKLNGPQDVAVDTAGNLYIADTLNYRVRKVDTTGNITTYAGYGTQGNNEDGYPASVAEINPVGVATNLAGDLYISSGAGGIVRKVDTSGFISTVAGAGTGAIGGQATTAAITNAFLSRVDNNGDLLIPTGLQLLAAGPDGILQFGSQAVNVASSPLTVVLEDTGNNQLGFNTTIATVGGTNASDFTFGSSCGYSLMAGKTCKFGVNFTPGGTGSRSAYLSVPTNTLGTPQIVLLQGTGTGVSAPVASLTSTLAFPNTTQNVTSASLTATLSNTGNATLNISSIVLGGTNAADFAIVTSSNPCGTTLAAGASCKIAATFTPLGTSSYTATITVTDNSATPTQTVTLTGTGTAAAAPVASLTSTIAFPNTTQNVTSASLTATLSNTGNATLNISSILLGGTNAADFAIVTSSNPCGTTLAAGASCLIAATFTPLGTSSYTATITVTDNSATPTQTVTLTGSGTAAAAPVASLTSTIAFPNTTQGVTSAALTATLSNTGNATLNISSISLGGTNAADFAIVTSSNPCGTTLAAGASCLIAATFTPLGTSSYMATITVTDNSATPTQTVTLTGTGTAVPAPVASLTSSIAFPNTTQGVTSASLTATLSNTGNATLSISSISLGGTNAADFAIVTSSNPCGMTLAAGSSCLIAATFTPQGTTTYTATITVTDNSATTTQTTTLTGTGTAAVTPDFTIGSNTPPQTVIGGNPATYSITVTPIGGAFTGMVQFSATGLPTGSTATFTPSSLTPGSSAASTSLVITTIPRHAHLDRRMPWMPPAITVALLMPLLLWRRRRALGSMRCGVVLLAALLGGAMLSLSGCGGGIELPSTSTTYTISVTGTSGVTSHTTTVTLTVQ